MNQLNPTQHNNQKTLDCTKDVSLCGDFDELVDIRERLLRLEKQEAKLKQRIQQTMGNANKALFTNGEITWNRCKDSIGLNIQALLEDQPNLIDEYPQVCIGARRLLVKV